MKTDVYSWRVDPGLKSDLERAARRQNKPVSAVLDLAAREWLRTQSADDGDDAEQSRLHEAALECLGTFASGNADRSETVRKAVRVRIKRGDGR